MELALNLGWLAMATAMCFLWTHHARREGTGRSAQLVSLYDNKAMAQNPAETRCFQREDDLGALAHAPLHPTVALAPTLAAELPFNTFRSAVVGNILVPTVELPFLFSIQNRPPPTA
jgi:hypothetical protein